MKFVVNNWTDSDVESHWDNVASIYIKENDRVKQTHDQRFTVSISELRLFKRARVLNITSRDGEAAEHILQTCPTAEVINAEISSGLIKEAALIRPQIVQVKLESYSNLPFEDSSFDRILSLETLEHVSQPILFLKELYRVARPKSIMILSCPPATSEVPYRIYTLLFGGHGEGPHRFLPSKEVKAMLESCRWRLKNHFGSLLLPIGPVFLRNAAERLIMRYPRSWISEFGIRQFYVCERY